MAVCCGPSAELSIDDGRSVSDLLDHALDADAVNSGYVRAQEDHHMPIPRLTMADHESIDLPLDRRESTTARGAGNVLSRRG